MVRYASEKYTYKDISTGVEVTRLTGFRAHSNHLYFTNNCFFDNGRKIVFESDRGNALNFFSLDLVSGEIEQLTDLVQPPYPREFPLHEAFVDDSKGNCCFFYDNVLYRLSLSNRSMVPIYRIPDGFFHHVISISSDGEYVYTSITQYTLDRSDGDLPLKDVLAKNPLSQILRIPINGGKETIIHEEEKFLAHVNISPTDNAVLTFCHEGPWNLVDHRLWFANVNTKQIGKLHPCEKDEVIGHEYWYADGKRIGYHGKKNGIFQLGVINSDGSNDMMFEFPFETGHIFSHDEKMIIGDGSYDGRFLRLWQLRDGKYDMPRALCTHNCSFKRQRAHVHPRLTPDGRSVLYTSDESGYEQLYLARIPDDISILPYLDSVL